ncbi:hypothetical protein CTAYLR_010577 [Chrysophaeum taylorii]|uniref:Uncharacterized protein n=1 Tax=Chrysophaeum taylorii TaxID=2483200 RepID=A0AAD7U9R3_9STRA|nr:hypothetical protein CTAYLR_010577 [Chrysophaeum taylorii]
MVELPAWLKETLSMVPSPSGVSEQVGASLGVWRSWLVRGARAIIAENRRIDEDGTPLRGYIRFVREGWNASIAATYTKFVEASSAADAGLTELSARTVFLQDAAAKVNETRQHKPEVVVGASTVLAVALSLLGTRRRLIRNGVATAAATSAVVYGSLWWEKRPDDPPSGF